MIKIWKVAVLYNVTSPTPLHGLFTRTYFFDFDRYEGAWGIKKISPGDKEYIFDMFVYFPPVSGVYNKKWENVDEKVGILKFQKFQLFTKVLSFLVIYPRYWWETDKYIRKRFFITRKYFFYTTERWS